VLIGSACWTDQNGAAIIYLDAARGADEAITEALDAHVEARQADDEGKDDDVPGTLAPKR
jgi:hypothetical protein